MRGDAYPRLSDAEISDLPGLSVHGRVVLARLENTRFYPGQVSDAWGYWKGFVRNPGHRVYDYGAVSEGCGYWVCCATPAEVRAVLMVVAGNLSPRDARRFRRELARLDELW